MIINLGCASVDNHIPRDDIFDYNPLKNYIYIILFLRLSCEHSTNREIVLLVTAALQFCCLDTCVLLHVLAKLPATCLRYPAHQISYSLVIPRVVIRYLCVRKVDTTKPLLVKMSNRTIDVKQALS